MKVNYPKVKQDSKKRVYVDFSHKNKRYRLFNGNKINSSITPNSYPLDKRIEIGQLLAAEVYKFLNSGKCITEFEKSKLITPNMTDKEYLAAALEIKLRGNYSLKYKSMLEFVYNALTKGLNANYISSKAIYKLLNQYNSGVSYNTIKRHLQVLINEAVRLGMNDNPMKEIKPKKSNAKLHKPFKDVGEVLEEVKSYNKNLYLCCLLTYGCLLRPHREVRELTWNDFSEDLSYIKLSGERNKSGKNRIVPIPNFIKTYLVKKENNKNIFTSTYKPLNKDYFKTLWSRFKQNSKTLEQYQTLYSFRHSGAIEIFKRTGSITKLQKAMGHSNINVSLTYLRGLELPELREEDMPLL